MQLNSKAQAVAQVDAICDQFEREFMAETLVLDSSITSGMAGSSLEPWTNQVPPELRAWLREELIGLREELLTRRDGGSVAPQTPPIPEGVSERAWEAVSQCVTFENLSESALVSLARSIELRAFPTGSVLLAAGQASVGLFVILEGKVSIRAVEDDQRAEIDTDGPGAVLGEMSMLTGHVCSADVVASEDVLAFVLPVEALEQLRGPYPEIEIALSQLVSDRLGCRSHDALCGKTLGGYRLERCIGNGAMGVVYSARRVEDGKVCALKMMRHRFIYDSNIISRFDSEAEFLSNLKHPNVVALRGHFVDYRTRFIVLDLYDGADLRDISKSMGGMDESTVRGVLGQIAAGLQYAHAKGVLHLDLKPANILVDRSGQIAVTDFGLGRLVHSDGCDEEVVGTPLYMPPEQFSMTDVGPHSDWYSFACIGIELLTGQRIFAADSLERLHELKRMPADATLPVLNCNAELRQHLVLALQPEVRDRCLDLERIAKWARPVPELAAAMK